MTEIEGGVELTAWVPLQRPLTATYAGASSARSVYEKCQIELYKVHKEVTSNKFRELRRKTAELGGGDRQGPSLQRARTPLLP